MVQADSLKTHLADFQWHMGALKNNMKGYLFHAGLRSRLKRYFTRIVVGASIVATLTSFANSNAISRENESLIRQLIALSKTDDYKKMFDSQVADILTGTIIESSGRIIREANEQFKNGNVEYVKKDISELQKLIDSTSDEETKKGLKIIHDDLTIICEMLTEYKVAVLGHNSITGDEVSFKIQNTPNGRFLTCTAKDYSLAAAQSSAMAGLTSIAPFFSCTKDFNMFNTKSAPYTVTAYVQLK